MEVRLALGSSSLSPLRIIRLIDSLSQSRPLPEEFCGAKVDGRRPVSPRY